MVSVITAYRTCQGHISTAPLGSTYAREHEYYKRCGQKSPNPRKSFVDELGASIRDLINAQHQVILSLDANSTLESDKSLSSHGRLM